MFETFPHTADVGLRVRAPSLSELFAEAGRGLGSLLVENVDEVEPREEVTFELEGSDREYLLVDWLHELLYTFESRHLVLSRFEIDVTPTGLRATGWGEALDAGRHRVNHEVKAVTYHGLEVEATAGGWQAEVILDI